MWDKESDKRENMEIIEKMHFSKENEKFGHIFEKNRFCKNIFKM